MYSPVQWAGIIECFFIFHLLLVSTSCWKNSPLSELLMIWNTGTHMCRHCIVIIVFRSDGSTVNTFQIFRQDPNSKVYTPLQWRHMGDMVFQTTVNSTMFKSLPRLTKKTHQCIIGHLDSHSQGASKAENTFPCYDVISNTRQGHMNKYGPQPWKGTKDILNARVKRTLFITPFVHSQHSNPIKFSTHNVFKILVKVSVQKM